MDGWCSTCPDDGTARHRSRQDRVMPPSCPCRVLSGTLTSKDHRGSKNEKKKQIIRNHMASATCWHMAKQTSTWCQIAGTMCSSVFSDLPFCLCCWVVGDLCCNYMMPKICNRGTARISHAHTPYSSILIFCHVCRNRLYSESS